MLLCDIHESATFDTPDGQYEVRVAEAPAQVLRIGVTAGTPKSQFDHPNLLARFYELHEYKHYRQNGTKFWTSKPGCDLLFAVPRDRIAVMTDKPGYSYPKVRVGGQVVTLNVSGGTGGGTWTDYIDASASTGTNLKLATIRAIADVAITVGEAKALGLSFGIPGRYRDDTDEQAQERRDAELREVQRLLCKKQYGPLLDQGHQVVLGGGWSINGQQGPFPITGQREKRKRNVTVCEHPYRTRVAYQHIDWRATAEANGWEIPPTVDVNRLPQVTSEAA